MESLGWPLWLAAVTFLFTLLAAIELFIGNRSVEALRDMPFVPEANPKRVSIIVAARNEQRNIRSALQSLIELEYSNYELIVVYDRSEDGTGQILNDIQAVPFDLMQRLSKIPKKKVPEFMMKMKLKE